LIMPSFGEPWDSKAKEVFQTVAPNRQIRQVTAREIILGGGGFFRNRHNGDFFNPHCQASPYLWARFIEPQLHCIDLCSTCPYC